MKGFVNDNIMFYGPKELENKPLFGYRGQLKAGTGMGLSVAQGGSFTVLLLGFPRTGKSVLPFALTRLLNGKYSQGFSLLTIDCDGCVGRDYEKELFEAIKLTEDHPPTVIFFDEFEGCAPIINVLPPDSPIGIISRKIRFYTSERKVKEKTLIMCVTNYPDIIELSTRGNFNAILYFDPADEVATSEIIKHYLKLDDTCCKETAKVLTRINANNQMATIGDVVIKGCQKILNQCERQKYDLNDKTPDEIAKKIEQVSGWSYTLEEIVAYENKYDRWITFAKRKQKWHEEEADEIIEEQGLEPFE